MIGPLSWPFLALKIAVSSAFSCWPLATASSTPPWAFDAWSIENFLATVLNGVPESIACLACSAFGLVFVSTIRRSRRSGCAKRRLFLL